jgi:hypothetical protein
VTCPLGHVLGSVIFQEEEIVLGYDTNIFVFLTNAVVQYNFIYLLFWRKESTMANMPQAHEIHRAALSYHPLGLSFLSFPCPLKFQQCYAGTSTLILSDLKSGRLARGAEHPDSPGMHLRLSTGFCLELLTLQ